MIGIFDSGVGGLSVFREILKVLPEEKYIYYSDNAHCPYGEKPREYIIDRAREISRFLIGEGADIIVVACNTATAAAIATLREEFPLRFIGMEPAIKPAAKATKTGIVGVLATAGTLKATKYIDTCAKWAENVQVVEHIGQGFVELVECGNVDGPDAEATVRRSLTPLLDAGADSIVLGCTHYPFLIDTMRKVSGSYFSAKGQSDPIVYFDPAPAVARHLADVMEEEGKIKREGFSMSLHASGEISVLENMFSYICPSTSK